MKMSSLSALATSDPVVRHVSGCPTDHPRDIPAYRTQLAVELDTQQRRTAEAMMSGEGKILSLVRSAIAQLGVDIEAHAIRLAGNTMHIDASLLITPVPSAERVMQQIGSLYKTYNVAIGRVALLPDNARLTQQEVIDALAAGEIRSRGATVDPDASLTLPLQESAHVFTDSHPSPDVLASILTGRKSGRALLDEVRTRGYRSSMLHSREFIVGEIDVHTTDYHLVLNPATTNADGAPTHAVHLGALLLDAGRTQHGLRHAELWNANGSPVHLDTLRLHASVYRAGTIVEPGI